MQFELARLNLPNLAAVVALALAPLIVLPMQRHAVTTAKAQPVETLAAEQATPANVAYAIVD